MPSARCSYTVLDHNHGAYFCNLFHSKLVWHDVKWDSMPVDQTISKHSDSSDGHGPKGIKKAHTQIMYLF